MPPSPIPYPIAVCRSNHANLFMEFRVGECLASAVRDRVFGARLDTSATLNALFNIERYRFSAHQFIHAAGTSLSTVAVAGTFVIVYLDSHFTAVPFLNVHGSSGFGFKLATQRGRREPAPRHPHSSFFPDGLSLLQKGAGSFPGLRAIPCLHIMHPAHFDIILQAAGI